MAMKSGTISTGMMKYAKIKGKEFDIITTRRVIPDDMLDKKGLSKIIDIPPTIELWQDCSSELKLINEQVEVVYTVTDISLDKFKKSRIIFAKDEARSFFDEKYDVIDLLSDDTQTQAKTLANTLKDKFLSYKSAVNACTSYQEVEEVPLE